MPLRRQPRGRARLGRELEKHAAFRAGEALVEGREGDPETGRRTRWGARRVAAQLCGREAAAVWPPLFMSLHTCQTACSAELPSPPPPCCYTHRLLIGTQVLSLTLLKGVSNAHTSARARF